MRSSNGLLFLGGGYSNGRLIQDWRVDILLGGNNR